MNLYENVAICYQNYSFYFSMHIDSDMTKNHMEVQHDCVDDETSIYLRSVNIFSIKDKTVNYKRYLEIASVDSMLACLYFLRKIEHSFPLITNKHMRRKE